MYFGLLGQQPSYFDGNLKFVQDIFKRVAPNDYLRNLTSLETVTIDDGETPEILSHLLYQSPHYHWTFFVVNNMTDPRKDWPMSRNSIVSYCVDKYGSIEEMYETHHFETTDDDKLFVDYDAQAIQDGDIIEVTNFDYEDAVNENKRQIKALNPKDLNAFLSEFNRLIGS